MFYSVEKCLVAQFWFERRTRLLFLWFVFAACEQRSLENEAQQKNTQLFVRNGVTNVKFGVIFVFVDFKFCVALNIRALTVCLSRKHPWSPSAAGVGLEGEHCDLTACKFYLLVRDF